MLRAFPFPARFLPVGAMLEPSAVLLLLGLIGACLVALTFTIVWLTWNFHQTLRRLDALLNVATPAIREARRSLQELRRILEKTHHATRTVEMVVQRACDAASEALEHVADWTGKARSLWRPSHRTNGARGEPRRRHPGA
ncbi:MAG: hypothetical protein COV75_00545 [Candidatus Omnitrophica bacterium CG11_big_fil_rev_8_21_14_0_20_63_9]|nr:MAG: hypothetical protein COV75_00545 [Candidatus Omnitrophica bacterium CG11_big_fil_rev_8_21_14_0_20_63_9]